jgi:ATP-binding cassette subfamily F protein uup
MKDFLFQPEQARSPVSVLSGGERGRLMLARALAKPSNLLVLDEPTNDLDLETLDLLQELLADYQGTLLLVSHDRDFLDRVVTSTIAPDGSGRWIEYAGGYSDMIAQRKGAEPEKAARPRPERRETPPAAATEATAAAKRKLSFKEKHALATLPEAIARLEAEIATLETQLADTRLYAEKPALFAAASERLGAAQAELASAEEQWLELEILRTELER